MKSVICYYPKGHTMYQGEVHDNETLAARFVESLKQGLSFPVPTEFSLCLMELNEDGEEWKDKVHDE